MEREAEVSSMTTQEPPAGESGHKRVCASFLKTPVVGLPKLEGPQNLVQADGNFTSNPITEMVNLSSPSF